MAQLTLVLQILGHDISIGIGADIEKSQESEVVELQVIESSGDHTIRQVGFVRNVEEEEDDEDDRIHRVSAVAGRVGNGIRG
jgi:hypothetical protein